MQRRDFFKHLGAMGALSFLGGFGGSGAARSASADDYRALVCIFLYGGNDGNNMLLPIDKGGYADYSTVRTVASGINLNQSAILPLTGAVPGQPYVQFGLHPALGELQQLFSEQKLALLCNVGPLLQPSSKADYLAGKYRPESLFSHSDQQNAWQSSLADGQSRSGWGGRLADSLQAMSTSGEAFPIATSVAGTVLFATGDSTTSLVLPASGGFSLRGVDNGPLAGARLKALKALVSGNDENLYVSAANRIADQALRLSDSVSPVLSSSTSIVQSLFSTQNNSLAQQLLQVAKLIEARQTLGVKRQIFFVSLGGFDTHNNQLATQQNLFSQLAPALKSFYDATLALGIAGQVTTFTLSDFGRTFKAAAGGGSDHAWGNHQLILGGAVRGGALYGHYPTLQLSGPDDISNEGRWLPTTAVDQYAATLARWMGVGAGNLAAVTPYIGRFAQSDLGFMV